MISNNTSGAGALQRFGAAVARPNTEDNQRRGQQESDERGRVTAWCRRVKKTKQQWRTLISNHKYNARLFKIVQGSFISHHTTQPFNSDHIPAPGGWDEWGAFLTDGASADAWRLQQLKTKQKTNATEEEDYLADIITQNQLLLSCEIWGKKSTCI